MSFPNNSKNRRRKRIACIVFTVLLAGRQLHPHSVSQSEARIEVSGAEARVVLQLNLLEFRGVDADGNGVVSYDELNNAIAGVYSQVIQHYQLQVPEAPQKVLLESYAIKQDHVGEFHLGYQFSRAITEITINDTLSEITTPQHQHLVRVRIGGVEYEGILNARNPIAHFGAGSKGVWRQTASFLVLGVLHILTGFDHLAFLLGLLVVTSDFKSLVKIVTSFTIAHSLTLALATLNIIVLPSRWTESAIALSIAYVAIENLVGRQAVQRYVVVFVFGLVHGFGFSSVLREMDLQRSHMLLSLLAFNFGVEIGQLVFVAIFFPLLAYLIASRWKRPVTLVVSTVILCLALTWFCQRAFLL